MGRLRRGCVLWFAREEASWAFDCEFGCWADLGYGLWFQCLLEPWLDPFVSSVMGALLFATFFAFGGGCLPYVLLGWVAGGVAGTTCFLFCSFLALRNMLDVRLEGCGLVGRVSLYAR